MSILKYVIIEIEINNYCTHNHDNTCAQNFELSTVTERRGPEVVVEVLVIRSQLLVEIFVAAK